MCSWKGLFQGVRGCCSHPQRSVEETSSLIVPKYNSFNSYFQDKTYQTVLCNRYERTLLGLEKGHTRAQTIHIKILYINVLMVEKAL